MIHFQSPINVKICDGIRVNLSLAISHAIEYALPKKRLKKEIADAMRLGTLKRAFMDADYEEYGKSDTLSFWFLGGTSLVYRVNEEITQEDFNRVVKDLESLEYRRKSDGVAGNK